MKLYYSIVDPAPAFRSDLAELFGHELAKLGLHTSWYMRPSAMGGSQGVVFDGQALNTLPDRLKSPAVMARVAYWVFDVWYLLGRTRRNTDAIQCRDKYIGAVVGYLVARMRRMKFFYWTSYPFPEHEKISASGRPAIARALHLLKAQIQFAFLYGFICRRADHVFVQSDQMLEDMAGYGIPRERMTPVPMGVPARMAEWVARNRVSVVPGRLVYLGTLASVRRLDMLLDAFVQVRANHPNAELVFVGDGDSPAERAALEHRTGELGLSDCVRFTGFVPMEEAWAMAASASVCLSPFYPTQVLRSASPTKLVEYLALGRPVVCNDHPEQSQIIASSGAGLCVPWGSKEFAGAISAMLSDPLAAEQMAAKGPAWVAANRTYPQIAAKLWATYQRLLSEGPRRG